MAFDFPSSPTLGQTYSVSGGPTYVYNGTAWQVLTPGGQFARVTFTATAGQTTFSTNYIVGAIDVFHNGVKLAPADFTATNGTSIVLVAAANAGDTIEVVSYAQVNYTNTVQKTGDTMTGNLIVNANVGIGTSSPSKKLAVSDAGAFGIELSPNDAAQSYNRIINYNRSTSQYVPVRYEGSTQTWYVGTAGSVRALDIDASGNIITGSSLAAASTGITLPANYNLSWYEGSNQSIANVFRQASSGATVVAYGYKQTNTANGFASSYSSSLAKAAITLDTGIIRFYTDAAAAAASGTDVTPSERARFDASGNFMVGTTSPTAGAKFTAYSSGFQTTMSCLYNGTDAGTPVIRTYHQATSGSARLHIYFTDGTTNGVGSITSNGTSTAYNTSSDYRLKQAVQPMQNGLATITALNPVTYTWKADGSRGEGFIAHELAEHVPLAVIGEKDAVDEEGNIKAQAVDYSKVVVHLVAAVKELSAKLDAAEARIAALEGAAA